MPFDDLADGSNHSAPGNSAIHPDHLMQRGDSRWAGRVGEPMSIVLFPALLAAGLFALSPDAWRQFFELALLPTFLWYGFFYGWLGRRARVAVALPVAWVVWLGASGGFGTEAAWERWDHIALASFMTMIFFLTGVIYFRSLPRRALGSVGTAGALAGGLALAIEIGRYAVGHGFELTSRISGTGLFENPNRGSAIAIFVSLVSMERLTSVSSSVLRAAMLAVSCVSLVYVLMSGSRGGALLFVATALVFVLIKTRFRMRYLAASVAALTLLLGIFVVLVPSYPDFLLENLRRDTFRVGIWRDSIALSLERPWLGHGWGDETTFFGPFSHPHNLHLSNFFFGGIVAALLGLALQVQGLVLAFRLDRCRALGVSAVCLIIGWTTVDGSLPIGKPGPDWYQFWLPVALVWGLSLRTGGTVSTSTSSARGGDGFLSLASRRPRVPLVRDARRRSARTRS